MTNAGTSGVDGAINRYSQGWISPVQPEKTDPNAQKFDDINNKLDSMQANSQGQSAQTAPTATAALPAPTATAALRAFANFRAAPAAPAATAAPAALPAPALPAPALPASSAPKAPAPKPPASAPAAPKPPAVTGAQPAAPKAPRMNTGQGKARIQAGITQKLGIPRTANTAAGVASSVLRLRRALSNASS